MAQKRKGGGTPARSRRSRWIGLGLLALGVFFLAALLTYSPHTYRTASDRGAVSLPDLSEPMLHFAESGRVISDGPLAGLRHNVGGPVGLWLTALWLKFLGWVGVWGVPLALLAWGWNRLLGRPPRRLIWRSGAAVPLIVTLVTMAAVPGRGWGGWLGAGLWSTVRGTVGPVGGILLVLVAFAGFFLLEAEAWDGRWGESTRAVGRWLRRAGSALLRGVTRGLAALVAWFRGRPWEREASVGGPAEPASSSPASPTPAARGARAEAEEKSWPPRIVDPARDEAAESAVPAASPAASAVPSAGPPAPPSAAPAAAPPAAAAPPPAAPAAGLRLEDDAVIRRGGPVHDTGKDVEDAVMEARRLAREGRKAKVKKSWGRMVLPTTEILDDVPDVGPPVAEDELIDNSRTLTETLRDFGVSGRVGEVHPGPVITRYEYVPGPGIKVVQILNRQDDLALKLRASRIRIIAPIPGKAAVGIEVPNRNPAPIFLRRLLETRGFSEASGPLPLALGRDIGGSPVVTELSRMPHLMIAGTTGSGKSVCMNALITSLLLKRTPEEMRLLMIDPKMLELPMYNGIPHLLTEVVTDPKLAARSLKWLLLEMERRYRVLSARGCRNIQSYNQKMDKEGPVKEDEEKLPYIVVLIDELADLMVTSGKEVEEPIARLAQTARAVGIHLIIATQRPSVDVITGVIKANFPARIAFQVASRIDSRTILDQNGAESLLGKGDMLFLPPGQAAPVRVHGAFVSESETQRLAEVWRDQGEPEAHHQLEEALAEKETAAGAIGDDPHFEDAARLVVAAGQASASMLQRRLKVGYARAARLVDMMEMAGIVSTQDGSKPRDILVDEVRLEHVLAGRDE